MTQKKKKTSFMLRRHKPFLSCCCCIQASIDNQHWLCSTLKFPRENIKLIICFMMEYCIVFDRDHFTPQLCIEDAVKWVWCIENSKVGWPDTLQM